MERQVFDDSDFRIFEIPDFAGRMGAIRSRLQPKLASVGPALIEVLNEEGEELHLHVAKHMRRRVNPPPETWLALGRDRRGYKRFAHLALAVSGAGCHARLVLKPECEDKRVFAEGLRRDLARVSEYAERLSGLTDFAGWDGSHLPAPLTGPRHPFWRDLAQRLLESKTAGVDLGFSWLRGATFGDDFLQRAGQRFRELLPLYRIAVVPGLAFSAAESLAA